MNKVVLDTNVLVSAFWKRPSNAGKIIDMIAMRQLIPYHNAQILLEYLEVLNRPRFKFPPSDVNNLLKLIKNEGISVISRHSSIPFVDESDRKFYDIASTCGAYLITGNIKHYPDEPFILTPGQFLISL
jgi:putative PIN family toxin of toxin-antitoxin system